MSYSSGKSEIERNDTDSGDRRVRKTRAALKKALSSLMMKKSINSISVKELTELADINRGTFYLHYKDVFDLLRQSEEDLMNRLRDTVNSIPADEVVANPNVLFVELYRLCRKNSDMVSILISEKGDIKFLNSLTLFLRDKCLHDWSLNLKNVGPQHFDAYYAFVVGGCLGLIQHWFSSGMKETPEELAAITSSFINQARSHA